MLDCDVDLDLQKSPSAQAYAELRAQEHRVTLLPAGKMFVAQLGESLLDAAARAGIRLPHQCKTGSCGACRAQCCMGRSRILLGPYPPR